VTTLWKRTQSFLIGMALAAISVSAFAQPTVGTVFTVNADPAGGATGYHAAQPQIAYNPEDNTILIAWIRHYTNGIYEARASLYDASTLTPVSAAVTDKLIGAAGNSIFEFEQLVATYSPSLNRFIVAHTTECSLCARGARVMQLNKDTLNPVLTTDVSESTVDDLGVFEAEDQVDVAISSDNDNILLVWKRNYSNTPGREGIWGSLIASNGGFLITDWPIVEGNDPDFPDVEDPAVTFDPAIGAFVIAFHDVNRQADISGAVANQFIRGVVVDDVPSAGELVVGDVGIIADTDPMVDFQFRDQPKIRVNPNATGPSDAYMVINRFQPMSSTDEGVEVHFFGVGAGPSYTITPGTRKEVIAAGGVQSFWPDFDSINLSAVIFTDLQPSGGADPANVLKYVLIDEDGDVVHTASGGDTIRSGQQEIVRVDDDNSHSSDVKYISAEAQFFAVWTERAVGSSKYRISAAAIDVNGLVTQTPTPTPTPIPLATHDWEIFK
jgi:hypothetical protein